MNIDFSNPWTEATARAAIIIVVYIGIRLASSFLISQFLKNGVKAQTSPSLLKLFRRVIGLVALDLVIREFPLPPRIGTGCHNVIFVLIVYLITVSSFEVWNTLGKNAFKSGAQEILPLISTMYKLLASVIALMIVMRHFNYDIWHIVTALGIGSLAVGLAAQPTLTNMIAGFTILVDRPFCAGDRIKLSTGEEGDVIHVGMRSTRLQTPDGNMLIVPNQEVVNTRVINFSLPNHGVAQILRFYFDLGTDMKNVKNILTDSLRNIQGTPGEVKALCSGIQDGSVELTLIFEVENFSHSLTAKDKIIDMALATLRAHGISPARHPLAGVTRT